MQADVTYCVVMQKSKPRPKRELTKLFKITLIYLEEMIFINQSLNALLVDY